MRILQVTGKLIGVVSCALLLSGCWDRMEPEELAFVTALGLDKDEKNENQLKITYVIANPEAGAQAGEGAGNEPPTETISFAAEDFNISKGLANTVVAKKISYDLLRVLMVSEKFARDEDFIRWIYDVTKTSEIRRDIHLLITKEAPETFIQNNQPKLDTRSHKFYELMFSSGQDAGTIPPSHVYQYFQITEGDADVYLGMYASTEKSENRRKRESADQYIAGELNYEGQTNTAEFAGSAVFNEGIMIDTLTVEETRLAYLLNTVMKQPDSLITDFTDPFDEKFKVTTKIERDGKVQFNMDLQEDTPSLHAIVPLQLDILTNRSMTDLSKDKDAREKLRKSLEDAMDQRFQNLIKKTQEELGGEPFSWSLAARKEFLTIPAFDAFNWKETYPKMDITIETQIKFDNFGRQTDLPQLEKVRD